MPKTAGVQRKKKTEKETAIPTEDTDLPTPMCLYIPAAASWLVSLAPGLTVMVHLSCDWIHLPGVKWLYEEESRRRENTYVSLWNLYAINRSGQRKKEGRRTGRLWIHQPGQQKAIKLPAKDEMPRCGAGGCHCPSCGCCNKLPQTSKPGGLRR